MHVLGWVNIWGHSRTCMLLQKERMPFPLLLLCWNTLRHAGGVRGQRMAFGSFFLSLSFQCGLLMRASSVLRQPQCATLCSWSAKSESGLASVKTLSVSPGVYATAHMFEWEWACTCVWENNSVCVRVCDGQNTNHWVKTHKCYQQKVTFRGKIY